MTGKPDDLVAPPGTNWICAACGKRSPHLYGDGGDHGWDVSCTLNAHLVPVADAPPRPPQADAAKNNGT